MQNNVKRHLELQREVRVVNSFINGKSMSELHKEKRQKRNFPVHKENYHLMLTDGVEDDIIVTPSPTVITEMNKRWYINNLLEGGSVS